MGKWRYKVAAADAGRRLDSFLSFLRNDLSRSRIKKLIDRELVLVNGEAAKASYVVKAGDDLLLNVPEEQPLQTAAQQIDLDVVYEDDFLVVVDKPAGMVVHPAAGNPDGTMVNALLGRYGRLSGIGAPLRPGIVHRLDKDTSGLIVVARSDAAHLDLARQFAERTVTRAYYAVVFGAPSETEGVIKSSLGRHPKDRKRFSSITRHGRSAVTEWEVIRSFSHVSFLRLKLHTGRTHQIRVHMKEAGYPLVGDQVYGSRKRLRQIPDKDLQENIAVLKRQALHAYLLGFTHPASGKRLQFESPLPPDLEKLLAALTAAEASK